MDKLSKKSAMVYVLLGIIPYTRPNLLLSFKPNQFFNELERISGYSPNVLRSAFSRAKTRKLIIAHDNVLNLSFEGMKTIQPFIAKKLAGGGQLMVIFDIPEDFAHLRRKLRLLLRQLQFKPIQQSVWMSDKDHKKIIAEAISLLGVEDWVQLYEAARIS